jgi:hypothetical protein
MVLTFKSDLIVATDLPLKHVKSTKQHLELLETKHYHVTSGHDQLHGINHDQ